MLAQGGLVRQRLLGWRGEVVGEGIDGEVEVSEVFGGVVGGEGGGVGGGHQLIAWLEVYMVAHAAGAHVAAVLALGARSPGERHVALGIDVEVCIAGGCGGVESCPGIDIRLASLAHVVGGADAESQRLAQGQSVDGDRDVLTRGGLSAGYLAVAEFHHIPQVVAQLLYGIVGEHGHGEAQVEQVGVVGVVGPAEVLDHARRVVVDPGGREVEVAKLHGVIELEALEGIGIVDVDLGYSRGEVLFKESPVELALPAVDGCRLVVVARYETRVAHEGLLSVALVDFVEVALRVDAIELSVGLVDGQHHEQHVGSGNLGAGERGVVHLAELHRLSVGGVEIAIGALGDLVVGCVGPRQVAVVLVGDDFRTGRVPLHLRQVEHIFHVDGAIATEVVADDHIVGGADDGTSVFGIHDALGVLIDAVEVGRCARHLIDAVFGVVGRPGEVGQQRALEGCSRRCGGYLPLAGWQGAPWNLHLSASQSSDELALHGLSVCKETVVHRA